MDSIVTLENVFSVIRRQKSCFDAETCHAWSEHTSSAHTGLLSRVFACAGCSSSLIAYLKLSENGLHLKTTKTIFSRVTQEERSAFQSCVGTSRSYYKCSESAKQCFGWFWAFTAFLFQGYVRNDT